MSFSNEPAFDEKYVTNYKVSGDLLLHRIIALNVPLSKMYILFIHVYEL